MYFGGIFGGNNLEIGNDLSFLIIQTRVTRISKKEYDVSTEQILYIRYEVSSDRYAHGAQTGIYDEHN